ncbi:MAG: DNA repair protein RecN [Clostridiales bacterium]|nr:DNA repair protein RecN [Clostridiales bacterium]
MIQSLSIRNIALIDQLDLEFHPGLQVLSGETGAGKSIVVDSVILILGGRADRTMIRSGCTKASVEAIFDLSAPSPKIVELMERESIEYDGQTVTVYREISESGKNICRVCGVLVPLSFLREIAPLLMNLHGQSEHQFLADSRTHLDYLDQMGGEEHRRLLSEVRDACGAFIANHREYARLVRKNENREMRSQQLEKEIEVLRSADIHPGEEEKLTAEIRKMQNAAKISTALHAAYRLLMSGDEQSGSMQSIREAARLLRPVSSFEPDADTLADRCDSIFFDLEDVAFQVNQMMERNEDDPVRLEQAENRLETLRRLERRYGSTEEDVLSAYEKLEEELADLNGLEERIARMGREHKELLAVYRAAARRLSESRMEIARGFEKDMMRELSDLGMAQTVFRVEFRQDTGGKPKMPSENGDDSLEFMICPNPGEPLMPLAKIASGGELSRLMLAMKVLEACHTGIETMVFDEIDTGISGRMAQTVAEKMILISRRHQVICVSHLPQLAAAGDWQYLVSKGTENGRTLTRVSELDRKGRIGEIARMISGADGISPEASGYAQQMLTASENRKSSLVQG